MEQAKVLFDSILRAGPSQSTLLIILTGMKKEGRITEVIRECIKALNVFPDDIRLRALLAGSYLEEGLVSQAETELKIVGSDIDDLSHIFKLQAELFARQERTTEAVKAIKRYLAHKPDDQEAVDLLKKFEPLEEDAGLQAQKTPEEKAEVTEEELFSVLATPTIAELYYNQGYIDEAISTYESYLLKNADDKSAIKRIAELQAIVLKKGEPQIVYEDKKRAGKEKMIAVLEVWLSRIRELKYA